MKRALASVRLRCARLRQLRWSRVLALPAVAFGLFAQFGFAASFELAPGPASALWKLGYAIAAAFSFFLAGRLCASRGGPPAPPAC